MRERVVGQAEPPSSCVFVALRIAILSTGILLAPSACQPIAQEDDGSADDADSQAESPEQECTPPTGDPQFGNCGEFGFDACGEDNGAVCLNTPSREQTVCAFPDCDTVCDCPPQPESGTAPVSCVEAYADRRACLLDCSDGQTCPDGMVCAEGACFWTNNANPMGQPQPAYGDCLLNGGQCQDERLCGRFSENPPIGACMEPCEATSECAPSPGGTATVTCQQLPGDQGKMCILECSNGECPDGMICLDTVVDFNLCGWLTPGHGEPPPPDDDGGTTGVEDGTTGSAGETTGLGDGSTGETLGTGTT